MNTMKPHILGRSVDHSVLCIPYICNKKCAQLSTNVRTVHFLVWKLIKVLYGFGKNLSYICIWDISTSVVSFRTARSTRRTSVSICAWLNNRLSSVLKHHLSGLCDLERKIPFLVSGIWRSQKARKHPLWTCRSGNEQCSVLGPCSTKNIATFLKVYSHFTALTCVFMNSYKNAN